jgi:hypothetical protein
MVQRLAIKRKRIKMMIRNKRRKIRQRNKILVESFIAGISFAIIILGWMFLAYGLQA